MNKWRVLLVLLVAVFFVYDATAQGCSQCKLLTEQGSELDENSFGSNINTGILYLMIIPYLLIMFLFRKRLLRFFKGLFAKS